MSGAMGIPERETIKERILEMMLEGIESDSTIIARLKEEGVISGTSPKYDTVKKWCQDCRVEIMQYEVSDGSPEAAQLTLNMQVMRAELLYNAMMRKGQYKDALQALRLVCQLKGLLNGKPLPEVAEKPLEDLTEEELLNRLPPGMVLPIAANRKAKG